MRGTQNRLTVSFVRFLSFRKQNMTLVNIATHIQLD